MMTSNRQPVLKTITLKTGLVWTIIAHVSVSAVGNSVGMQAAEAEDQYHTTRVIDKQPSFWYNRLDSLLVFPLLAGDSR